MLKEGMVKEFMRNFKSMSLANSVAYASQDTKIMRFVIAGHVEWVCVGARKRALGQASEGPWMV